MLELNRLKPMPPDYDKELFNRLYSKTLNLRRNLTRGIDHTRFGLQPDDVLSFFDVKFIYTFSKHYKEPENILLGLILTSLQNFKCRILRSAYTQKFSQKIISSELEFGLEDVKDECTLSKSIYYDYLMNFMKTHLSMEAYTILDLQLNPPPYMYNKLNILPDSNLRRIPDQLLLDYLDLGSSIKAYRYLNTLKKEIKEAVKLAKENFNE